MRRTTAPIDDGGSVRWRLISTSLGPTEVFHACGAVVERSAGQARSGPASTLRRAARRSWHRPTPYMRSATLSVTDLVHRRPARRRCWNSTSVDAAELAVRPARAARRSPERSASPARAAGLLAAGDDPSALAEGFRQRPPAVVKSLTSSSPTAACIAVLASMRRSTRAHLVEGTVDASRLQVSRWWHAAPLGCRDRLISAPQ